MGHQYKDHLGFLKYITDHLIQNEWTRYSLESKHSFTRARKPHFLPQTRHAALAERRSASQPSATKVSASGGTEPQFSMFQP